MFSPKHIPAVNTIQNHLSLQLHLFLIQERHSLISLGKFCKYTPVCKQEHSNVGGDLHQSREKHRDVDIAAKVPWTHC